jgi:hypothetical protein
MKMVVVGGNSRNIGKTAVVAGLIRSLPDYRWTAIKLTQYGHGICAADGKDCDCAPEEHPFAVTEETNRSGESDTSRFLVAGASRALWVRVRLGMLETVLPTMQQAIAGADAVIVESNSILRFWQPNVYVTVLDPTRQDFKDSAREFLSQADGILLLGDGLGQPAWEGVSLNAIHGKPIFPISPLQYVTPEIAAFVEQHLAATEKALALPG